MFLYAKTNFKVLDLVLEPYVLTTSLLPRSFLVDAASKRNPVLDIQSLPMRLSHY